MTAPETKPNPQYPLPGVDELFATYFGMAYEPQDIQQRGFPGVRPDVVQAYKPGAPLDQIIPLGAGFRAPVQDRIQKILQATHEDWASYLKPIEDPAKDWFQKAGLIEGYGAKAPVPFPGQAWVRAFDAHFNEEAIFKLIDRSNPKEPSNDFIICVVELSVVLGEVLKARIPKSGWYLSWPYFDSSIYDPRFGTLCHVFDWALKKFSKEHWDDGLANKLEFCADGPGDMPNR